jgi:hypothetical protein
MYILGGSFGGQYSTEQAEDTADCCYFDSRGQEESESPPRAPEKSFPD